MAQYLTKAGDMLDEIAYLYYGNTNNKVVERILEVNFGLSQYDALLPAGVLIELPEVQQSTETRKVKLWD